MFSFPGTRRRYELPQVYWGQALLCEEQNQYYLLPGGEKAAPAATPSSIDQSIDTSFWNQL